MFKSPGYGVNGRELTPYPGDLNNCRNCTPAFEVRLTESPKHVKNVHYVVHYTFSTEIILASTGRTVIATRHLSQNMRS
jgi:hypothetical protein